jgi:hypothetical protein
VEIVKTTFAQSGEKIVAIRSRACCHGDIGIWFVLGLFKRRLPNGCLLSENHSKWNFSLVFSWL